MVWGLQTINEARVVFRVALAAAPADQPPAKKSKKHKGGKKAKADRAASVDRESRTSAQLRQDAAAASAALDATLNTTNLDASDVPSFVSQPSFAPTGAALAFASDLSAGSRLHRVDSIRAVVRDLLGELKKSATASEVSGRKRAVVF